MVRCGQESTGVRQMGARALPKEEGGGKRERSRDERRCAKWCGRTTHYNAIFGDNSVHNSEHATTVANLEHQLCSAEGERGGDVRGLT